MAQEKKKSLQPIPGAYSMNEYLPLLKQKRVALLINQTATVENQLLADTLIKRGVNVVKIFVPEHGFRGNADAGAHVANSTDKETGLPIISLYGNNKKPKLEQLKDVDVLMYDLQDVGVRFYTYISTLQYAMEACADAGLELIVLDRPNPNGWYVDGPVLQKEHQSFVGMQPIPIVYGMTAGEYAQMLLGEGMANNVSDLKMNVIPCKNYNHAVKDFVLPVPPSPNLKTPAAVALYPALCFFEGTVISVGRGTQHPFEQWGHPAFKGKLDDCFTPQSVTGASKPLLEGEKCYGIRVAENLHEAQQKMDGKLSLKWLLQAYNLYPDKKAFFNSFFEKVAGTSLLKNQIIADKTEQEIRASWQPEIAAFKKIRKKYLLYPDFE